MTERLTGSAYRRVSFPVAAALVVVLLVHSMTSDPNGTTSTNIALMSVLIAWLVFFGVRGWRSATLRADAEKVTVRQLVRSVSWRWQVIEEFTAETRPAPLMWFPVIRPQRRVLSVRLRDGRVAWLYELSCKPSADGQTWVDDGAQRLNALARLYAPSGGA